MENKTCSDKKASHIARVLEREAVKNARLERQSQEIASRSEVDLQAPAQTHLVCWWCVHPLPKLPCIHLPLKYDEKRKLFTTRGNFCSWQCAKAYALDMSTSRSGEIQMYLALMRKQAIGHYEPLWPAPARTFLYIFGGSMSIEEFRSYGGRVEPPIVRWPNENFIQPITGAEKDLDMRLTTGAGAAASGGKARMKAIENSAVSQDSLKLRRMKPLERTKSKLENVLGITRKTG
jgi:hypothetical protein